MKKNILAILVLAAFLCACTKDIEIEIIPEIQTPVDNTQNDPVFTATMEGSSDSRATLDGMFPSWDVGDQISVNGAFYAANTAGTSTTFSKATVIRPVYVSSTTPHSYNNNYPPSRLVDESGTSQEWCAHTNHKVNGVWNIVVSAGSSRILKTIQLWNARNTATFPERTWKKITVYGSESSFDGWKEIKTIDNLNLAINNYGFAGDVAINADMPYTFYRIDILENMGADYMQMSDMKFVLSNEIRPVYVATTTPDSYNNNPPSNLVDEKGTSTRWCASTDHKEGGVWNIIVSTGKSCRLNSVKLWNAENQRYPKRRWKKFSISGSESSTGDWSDIGTFDNLNLDINNYNLAGEIKVNARQSYTFYKIDVEENEGDDYMQMSDMKFDITPDTPYTAYFPSALYNGVTASLPSVVNETWADGKFNMPMYANSTSTDLHFKNLCGVMKIVVKKSELESVKSIRVSSANKAVSGEFTVVNDTAVLVSPQTTANTVTVIYDNAVRITDEGSVFYIALPAQTYYNLKIELSTNGNTFTDKMTTADNKAITIERNKIYPVNYIATTPNYVENGVILGKGIPVLGDWDNNTSTPNTILYWAPVNCGYEATGTVKSDNDHRLGKLYQWGAGDSSLPYKYEGSPVVAREMYYDSPTPSPWYDDAVINGTTSDKWNNNQGPCPEGWRLPRAEEFKVLCAGKNGNTGWVLSGTYAGMYKTYKGAEFFGANTDKGVGNGVFFPVAGYRAYYDGRADRDDCGYYWSSTPDSENIYDAYYLFFYNSFSLRPQAYINRAECYSVRCVTE